MAERRAGEKRRMAKTQGNSRSLARLLITGLITSRCLVTSTEEEKEKDREKEIEKRDINACGVRKKSKR